jgi:hypothetical protein
MEALTVKKPIGGRMSYSLASLGSILRVRAKDYSSFFAVCRPFGSVFVALVSFYMNY